MEYPKLLYRPGTKSRIWGIQCDTMKVNSAEEEEAALDDGWMLRPDGEARRKIEGLAALRAEYERVAGKRPFNGWDEATLREKIAGLEKADADAG